MNTPSQLAWAERTVEWVSNQERILVRYPFSIGDACVLDSDAVAVIAQEGSQSEAQILNADGTVRAQLKNPFPEQQRMIFYRLDYYKGRLSVVLAGLDGDYQCLVDEHDGSLSTPTVAR
jgi:hypothetical protein